MTTCNLPNEIQTSIPGLRLIENCIPNKLHDRFVQEMNKGHGEKNKGHYDAYDFEDGDAFDSVFYPLIDHVFHCLKEFKVLSKEKHPVDLACSLIGYEKDGFITRHIDSPLLSGGIVIVVSFNSPVVVNFYSEKKAKPENRKFFIPEKSIYVISEESRYDWSHAILADENTYDSKPFIRSRRYAIVLTPPGPKYSGSELLRMS